MARKLRSYEREPDHPHGDLIDVPLQEEIELVGTLVAAISPHDDCLSDSEIDRLLGVVPRNGPSCRHPGAVEPG